MSEQNEIEKVMIVDVRGGCDRVRMREMTKEEKAERLAEIADAEQRWANFEQKLQDRLDAIARLRQSGMGADVLKALMID